MLNIWLQKGKNLKYQIKCFAYISDIRSLIFISDIYFSEKQSSEKH